MMTPKQFVHKYLSEAGPATYKYLTDILDGINDKR